jgi:RNA polymerase sigma-70 factor (ECF subfamily)
MGTEVCEQIGQQSLQPRRSWEETRERTLVQRQEQFQTLITPTRQRLYRFARHTMGNAQDAEDITQETLARAWNHFESFDSRRSFEAWLFRIAQNLMIDWNRRKRRRPEISLDTPETFIEGEVGVFGRALVDRGSDPAGQVLDQEVCRELQSALCSLSAAHRQTLLLLSRERSYEQIARALDCPMGTVRSRVHRARVMLQRKLKEGMLEEEVVIRPMA